MPKVSGLQLIGATSLIESQSSKNALKSLPQSFADALEREVRKKSSSIDDEESQE
ncbi:MAG TPA: hypothetical protein VGX94_00780 [Terriglobia bacterium]|nr:hypothetical protein [Terriglobia bacterium]